MEKSDYYEDESKGKVIGNFHVTGKKRALRRTLCSIEEASYKISRSGIKQKRTDIEKAKLIHSKIIQIQSQLDSSIKKEKEKPKQSSQSIQNLSKNWLKDVVSRNTGKTVQTYSKTIEYFIEAVGNYNIEDHTSAHLNEFTGYLKNRKISTQTRIKYIRQLQAFFNWSCSELKIVKINLRNETPTTDEIETFSENELKDIELCILEKHKKANTKYRKMMFYNDYRAFKLLVNSGFRRAEVLTLTLDNILLDEKENEEIRVRENKEFKFIPKKNKKRSLPIVHHGFKEFLLEDVSRRSDEEKYFLDNGKGLPYLTSYNRFTKRFKFYCDDLGISAKKPRIKPLHAFRATYITKLVNINVDIFSIMKIVGHDNIETTQRYVNQNKDDIKKSLMRLND